MSDLGSAFSFLLFNVGLILIKRLLRTLTRDLMNINRRRRHQEISLLSLILRRPRLLTTSRRGSRITRHINMRTFQLSVDNTTIGIFSSRTLRLLIIITSSRRRFIMQHTIRRVNSRTQNSMSHSRQVRHRRPTIKDDITHARSRASGNRAQRRSRAINRRSTNQRLSTNGLLRRRHRSIHTTHDHLLTRSSTLPSASSRNTSSAHRRRIIQRIRPTTRRRHQVRALSNHNIKVSRPHRRIRRAKHVRHDRRHTHARLPTRGRRHNRRRQRIRRVTRHASLGQQRGIIRCSARAMSASQRRVMKVSRRRRAHTRSQATRGGRRPQTPPHPQPRQLRRDLYVRGNVFLNGSGTVLQGPSIPTPSFSSKDYGCSFFVVFTLCGPQGDRCSSSVLRHRSPSCRHLSTKFSSRYHISQRGVLQRQRPQAQRRGHQRSRRTTHTKRTHNPTHFQAKHTRKVHHHSSRQPSRVQRHFHQQHGQGIILRPTLRHHVHHHSKTCLPSLHQVPQQRKHNSTHQHRRKHGHPTNTTLLQHLIPHTSSCTLHVTNLSNHEVRLPRFRTRFTRDRPSNSIHHILIRRHHTTSLRTPRGCQGTRNQRKVRGLRLRAPPHRATTPRTKGREKVGATRGTLQRNLQFGA